MPIFDTEQLKAAEIYEYVKQFKYFRYYFPYRNCLDDLTVYIDLPEIWPFSEFETSINAIGTQYANPIRTDIFHSESKIFIRINPKVLGDLTREEFESALLFEKDLIALAEEKGFCLRRPDPSPYGFNPETETFPPKPRLVNKESN